MYRITFSEKVDIREFALSMGRAKLVCKERKIAGSNPTIQGRPNKSGILRKASVWYLLKVGRRYIDVLSGVLAGEGYLVKAEKIPNPWAKGKPPPREGAAEKSAEG